MQYQWDNGNGWIKHTAIWAAVGLLFVVMSEAPVSSVMISLAMGVVTGFAMPSLVMKRRSRWIQFAVSLLGLAVIILSVTAIHGFMKAGVWLGLGALYTATESLTSAITGERLCNRLNRHYEHTRKILRERYPQAHQRPGPIPEPVPEDTRDSFLACLPDDLRREAEGFFGISLVAESFRALESLSPTHSCLSGPALLPPQQPWPGRNGTPLEFLCQIRLQDLPATSHDRPSSGLLSFFIDPDKTPWGMDEGDADGFRVLYHPENTPLQPALRPGTGNHPPLRKPIRFHEVPEFIPSSGFEERFQEFIDAADEELAATADEWMETIRGQNASDVHRVLSLPVLAQYDMDDGLQVAARHFGMPEETRWTLLLQLDSDRDLGWSWGDAGYLYFWVPTDDLAAARFDRCWVVLQCS